MKIWINEIIEVLDALKIPYERYSEDGSAIRFEIKNIDIEFKEGSVAREGNLAIEITNYWIAVGTLKEGRLSTLKDKTILYLTKENTRDRVEFNEFRFTPTEMRGLKFEDIPNGYTLPSIFLGEYLTRYEDKPVLNKENWELYENFIELKDVKPLY